MLFKSVDCWYVLVVVLVGWLSQYMLVSMLRAVQLPGAGRSLLCSGCSVRVREGDAEVRIPLRA
jgi:hypothetical protein